jgi:LysR substrate binding domain
MASAIPMVAAGLGVTLVSKSMSRLHPDGVVFIPIEGPSMSAEICLGYRRTQRSAAVRNFVTIAHRQAKIAGVAPLRGASSQRFHTAGGASATAASVVSRRKVNVSWR